MAKIVFTSVSEDDREFYKSALKDLKPKIYTVNILKVPEEDLKDTEILSVFVHDKITAEILKKMPNLKLIHTRSTGFDHIDLDYCEQHGILVTHIPAYSPESVAQHAFAMLLALVRKLKRVENRIRDLNFSQDTEILGRELSDLTLGVIGTGRIGSKLALYGLAFGMNVLCYDIYEREELKRAGCVYTDLENLLRESDIVSLHIPYTDKTYHMINRETIKLMKEGTILINTSRGKIVDTDALYEAYLSGKFGGLGLDVFEDEKVLILKKYREGIVSAKALKILELANKDNVIITPHIAYYTDKSIRNIREETVKIITAFVKGEKEKIKEYLVVKKIIC